MYANVIYNNNKYISLIFWSNRRPSIARQWRSPSHMNPCASHTTNCMCDYCGHRFYLPETAIKGGMKGNTVSLTLWALNAVCYPPYVAACARTCSDRRRSAADASAGPPGKYPSGRTWCPHRWRGPLQQQQKRKGEKIVKINFTSHTFKADLGELQFLSFFLMFFFFRFFIIFLFLCLAISGSPFSGPLRAYPGQKIMWTLAGVACCLRLSPLRFRVCRRQLEILFPLLGTWKDSWDAQLWMFVLAAENSSSNSNAW